MRKLHVGSQLLRAELNSRSRIASSTSPIIGLAPSQDASTRHSRAKELLKKISQSLARLDTGEYGFCDETGEPIGLQRRLARPTASLSLEAQQRRELKQKMFGD